MKLLIATGIYPPSIGGPATYSKTLFDLLPEKGVRVKVLSFDEVRHFPKIIRHILFFLKVIRIGFTSDIIYAQDPVSVGLPAFLAARLIGKSFFLKIVGDYAWEQASLRESGSHNFVSVEEFQDLELRGIDLLRRAIERFVARRAKRVIVPSQYLKGIVLKWGVPAQKVAVIQNALAAITLPSQDKKQLRNELGMVGPTLVSAGRLVPWKGFGTLIETIAPLSIKFPSISLIIIGDGPDRKELERYIDDFGLSRHVRLLGRVSQDLLFKYLKAADVFVLNTAYEGFPHSLLEVMALGTPIVATEAGGNSEVVTDGEEGILIEYNHKKSLERSVERILTNEYLTSRLSSNALAKVKHFNTENMIEKLLVILNF